MKTTVTARLSFPKQAPTHGHFDSISVLDGLGYFRSGDDYTAALCRAGFLMFDEAGANHLAATSCGVFARGVGSDALALLDALAAEGFTGDVSEFRRGVSESWHLVGDRLITVSARRPERLCA